MSFVEVEILGRVFRLQGDEPERIQAFAEYVNTHVARIQSRFDVIDSGKILGLAALNIAEAFFNAQSENQVLKGELARLQERVGRFLQEQEM
jgi:cell division protein ZapA (FtsZ GTPase activity inhibitor)